MEFLFDSRNEHFKKPFGCIQSGTTLSLACYVKDAGETGVLFMLAEDNKTPAAYPMMKAEPTNGYNTYTLDRPFQFTGLFYYYFTVQKPDGDISVFKDGHNHPLFHQGMAWQLTCYHANYSVPESFRGRVMYQIFPDRFNKQGDCDTKEKLTPFFLHENPCELPVYEPDSAGIVHNNDFFGGNFQGIIEKLPSLKSLGVGAIYINPIFKAYSNHRYDTADYLTTDPMLGTNDDFARLCKQAHQLNMKIILDGVFSHTGSDSVYFDIHNRFGTGAYHNPDSPYRDWYQFHQHPHDYASWWGIKTLPCTQELNPGFMQFIFEKVIPYWLDLGADGWRLDVADELPEEFLEALYQTVKTIKKDAIVIGEVWEDASNKISYGVRRRYLQGKSLDSVMNYVWRDAIIRFAKNEMSASDFAETIMTLCEHYPKDALDTMMNFLSTHDTPRILTVLGVDNIPQNRKHRANYVLSPQEKIVAKNRLYLALFLLFTLPGSPCIYYGDEIGMEGFEDPFNRCYMGDRSGDNDILAHVKQLSRLKNQCTAFQTGHTDVVLVENGFLIFSRTTEKEKILCLVNTTPLPKVWHIDGETIFSEKAVDNPDGIMLLPYGCAAIKLPSVTFSPQNAYNK